MSPNRIWIVDDRESNRRFFADVVCRIDDVSIETFDEGEIVLAAARRTTPDLVLLDVTMPRMDGFAACRALRERFGAGLVPILLITANYDRELYSQAIEAGADDYLVQPIDVAELESRVRAFLRQRDRYRAVASERAELGARVEELSAEVASREDHLLLAERLAATGIMAAGINHQIRNPLTAVTLNLDYCLSALPGLLGDPSPDPSVERRRQTWKESFGAVREAIDMVIQLVSDVSTFARPDDGPDRSAKVHEVIDSVSRIAHHKIYPVATLRRELGGPMSAAIPPSRLAQVILTLLVEASSAIEASGQRGVITVRSAREGDRVVLEIEDTGGTPSADRLAHLFDPFGGGRQIGFGLSISRNLVRRVGGELTAAASAGGGTLYRVSLPLAAD